MGQLLQRSGASSMLAADPTPPPARSYSRTVPLAEGDTGTAQTVALIRLAVQRALTDPAVRETAARILRGVPAFDDLAEVRTIYQWVLDNIRYTRDPVNNEMVSDAAWTLEHGIGDCDDINAVLLPSLLMVIGHPARIVTIANDPGEPASFAHVYAETKIDGRWIPLDAAREGAQFGVAPKRSYRTRIWDLFSPNFIDIGLGGYLGDVTDWLNTYVIGPFQAFSQGYQTYQQTYNNPACIPGVDPGCSGPVYTEPTQPLAVRALPTTIGGVDTTTVLLIGGAALLVVLSKR